MWKCSPAFARRLWPLRRAVGGRCMGGPQEQRGGAQAAGLGGSGRAPGPRVRGHAVGAVVRSSPGDAVDCSSLRLAWAVSAWPPSPRGAGAQRDRRSAYWLWAGAAEAGEAREC
ncbi:uncharacterized protein LOC115345234 isoform X8 [Aquila chrysaetos chrysaetos]|uniref:uncharacterized protein LOC115345234 isoform X8 n=1 Tax=Aquila chrysaetos chrysaetos TaxID=223781 RepID=UPI0011772E6E|nr:uncharacterized protein LOC115345234 isoform X8 [Aquila chrysaetos chrysaetos]